MDFADSQTVNGVTLFSRGDYILLADVVLSIIQALRYRILILNFDIFQEFCLLVVHRC